MEKRRKASRGKTCDRRPTEDGMKERMKRKRSEEIGTERYLGTIHKKYCGMYICTVRTTFDA